MKNIKVTEKLKRLLSLGLIGFTLSSPMNAKAGGTDRSYYSEDMIEYFIYTDGYYEPCYDAMSAMTWCYMHNIKESDIDEEFCVFVGQSPKIYDYDLDDYDLINMLYEGQELDPEIGYAKIIGGEEPNKDELDRCLKICKLYNYDGKVVHFIKSQNYPSQNETASIDESLLANIYFDDEKESEIEGTGVFESFNDNDEEIETEPRNSQKVDTKNEETVVEEDESKLLQEISTITGKVYTNIFEISDFLNGANLPDTPYYVDFTNWLNQDSDRYVVGYFTELYNQIKDTAYVEGSRENTVDLIQTFLNNYYAYTIGSTLQFNTNGEIIELSYDDVSLQARVIIASIAQAIAMYHYDFQLECELNRFDILEIASNEYDLAVEQCESLSDNQEIESDEGKTFIIK